MRKIILLILSVVATICFIAGCEKVEKIDADLLGFEVEAEETQELGDVYEITKPFVYDTSKNYYAVLTDVKHNGKAVDVVGGMFELSEMGDYVITYSVAFNGETIEKTTTIKVVDTTGPSVLLTDIPNKVYVGETIDLSNITASDYSEIEVFNKTVIYGNDESITVENDSFVASGSGMYTINVYAKDKIGNETTESYKLEALNENQIYTFNTGNEAGDFDGGNFCPSIEVVESVHDTDGRCLKLTPSSAWFALTWKTVGNSSAYNVNLADEKYKDYINVCFDAYFETESTGSATVWDFNGTEMRVASNSWTPIEISKGQFNNGTVPYIALWADKIVAVYIDNVRLEKFNPTKYNFENGNVSGDFTTNQGTTSMAIDPVNSNNNVLLWEANAQWAALNFDKFNKETLQSDLYKSYRQMTLKVYIETDVEGATNVDFVNIFGISLGAVATNKWVTLNVDLDKVRAGTNIYFDVWDADLTSYKIYFDDIGVTGALDDGISDSADITWRSQAELS